MFEPVEPPQIAENLRWSYQPLTEAQHVDVRWVGPVHGLLTHHTGVTKPCRAELTGGALKCDLCEAQLPKRWRGYAPALSFHARRVVFLVGIDTGAVLTRTKPGACLIFGRGKGTTAPVVANPYVGLAAKTTPASFLPGGHFEHGTDLWPWLCRLWNDQELAQLLERSRARG